MKNHFKILLLTILLFIVSCASTEENTISSNLNTSFVILHTNDTHGRAIEGRYDGMGFARIMAKKQQLEKEGKQVLIVDAGDTFHGTTFASLSRGESIAKIMNSIDYAVMTVGNHDFNYGYERLIELDEITSFPMLAANVHYENTQEGPFDSYIIIDFAGIKIAFLGIATPETLYKTHPKNVEGLRFDEPISTVTNLLPQIKEESDLVVVIAHLGVDEESIHTSKKLASAVDGIDLIIDGHSHTALPEGIKVNNTVIAQAGEYDKFLGMVDINLSNGDFDINASLFSKEDSANIESNPEVLTLINSINDENKKITDEVLFLTDTDWDGQRENVRTKSTNLGKLITDSMIDISGADVALMNGGGIRMSINAGEVTKGDVISVLPFGNTVVVKEVTGKIIWDAIENGMKALPLSSGSYSHVGGAEFTFDATSELGSRVKSITINDEPINLQDKYSLVTNDFLAAGGDEYSMLKDTKTIAEYGTMDDVLIAYMTKGIN